MRGYSVEWEDTKAEIKGASTSLEVPCKALEVIHTNRHHPCSILASALKQEHVRGVCLYFKSNIVIANPALSLSRIIYVSKSNAYPSQLKQHMMQRWQHTKTQRQPDE